jgi:hypothetical protein
MIYQFFLGRVSLENSKPIANQVNVQFNLQEPHYCFDYTDAYFVFQFNFTNLDFIDKSPFFRFSMEEA